MRRLVLTVFDANPDQRDADGNGAGDVCDDDSHAGPQRRKARIWFTSVRRRAGRRVVVAGRIAPRRTARVTVRGPQLLRQTRAAHGRWRMTLRVSRERTARLRATTPRTATLTAARATARVRRG